ncbi:hypothetical protein CKO51_10875 [Rhodopirellula sp. SM50]|nr:hypothetical protein CKO51_10875 [Rhodopirellula sp. SM50]
MNKVSRPLFADRSEGGIDRAEPTVDGGADSDRRTERERASPTPRAEPDKNGARQDAEFVIKKGESDRVRAQAR